MADSKRIPNYLVDQSDALSLYLEALLKDAGFGEDDAEHQPPTSVPKPAVPNVPVMATSTVSASSADVLPLPLTQQHPIQPPSAPIERAGVATVTAAAPAVAEAPSAIPPWAVGRFQCLSFKIGHLDMAASLEQLNGIIDWDGEVTVLPGYPSWFLGLVRNRGQNVQVVDIAQVIKPAGDQHPDPLPAQQRAKFILLLDAGRWGVVCDAMANVLTLEKHDVRWRENSRHHIIAGTVVKTMCSLLNVDVLAQKLTNAFGD